jgi:hypothetical protein
MKVLSVKQPWAALLVNGIKDIENRTRRTTFRGRILIHASKAQRSEFIADFLTEEQAKAVCEAKIEDSDFRKSLVRGMIIGSIEIYDCVKNDSSIWAEKNVWNWKVRKPILFKKPIPAKGKLGLWNFEKEIDENNQ